MLFPSPGDLPNPGIELKSLASPALAGGLFTSRATWEAGKAGTVRVNPLREVVATYGVHLSMTTSLDSGFAEVDLTAGAEGL